MDTKSKREKMREFQDLLNCTLTLLKKSWLSTKFSRRWVIFLKTKTIIILIILTCDFHFLFCVLGSINFHQKVQDSLCVFPRQWNLVSGCLFKLRFEHGFEPPGEFILSIRRWTWKFSFSTTRITSLSSHGLEKWCFAFSLFSSLESAPAYEETILIRDFSPHRETVIHFPVCYTFHGQKIWIIWGNLLRI